MTVEGQPQPGAQINLVHIIARLAPYLRPRRTGMAFALLGMLGATIVELAKPWPLKVVFDAVTGSGQTPSGFQLATSSEWMIFLVAISVSIIGLALLEGFFSYQREYFISRTGQELAFDLRATLYAHIQRLSFGFHDRQRTGDLITCVTSDVDRIQDFLTDSLLTIISSVLSIAGMFAVMFRMDWLLGLTAFTFAPFLFLVVHRYTSRIRKITHLQRKQQGELVSVAQEAISAIRVVKAFAREDHESERFRRYGERNLEAGIEVSRLEAQFGWIVDVTAAFGTAAVIALGVDRVLRGAISPGDLIVFSTYLKNLYRPMRDFSKEVNRVSKATVRAERVIEVLDADADVRDEPDARPAPRFRGGIRFEDVSFGYRPDLLALRNVNFAVEPGQSVALVGASGAGKTTLAALIPRFYDPTEGRVLIDGTDIRHYTLQSLRSQISLVLQESVLFRATISENIAYGNPSASMADVIAAAQAAHVDEFVQTLPEGYDTVVGERGATLSGGQRQRIAIARAMVRNAPIVILDEPTTGLDAATAALVLDALAKLIVGRTTVIIAHDLATVRHADLILGLEHGRYLGMYQVRARR